MAVSGEARRQQGLGHIDDDDAEQSEFDFGAVHETGHFPTEQRCLPLGLATAPKSQESRAGERTRPGVRRPPREAVRPGRRRHGRCDETRTPLETMPVVHFHTPQHGEQASNLR